MKKFVWAGIIILGAVSWLKAEPLANNSMYAWKSSHTESADTRMLISSEGVLAFGGIFVGSGAASGACYVQILNNQIFGAVVDSYTVLDCTVSSAVGTTSAWSGNYLPVKLSSGLMYTKVGTCKVDIFWDVLQRNPAVLPIRTR